MSERSDGVLATHVGRAGGNCDTWAANPFPGATSCPTAYKGVGGAAAHIRCGGCDTSGLPAGIRQRGVRLLPFSWVYIPCEEDTYLSPVMEDCVGLGVGLLYDRYRNNAAQLLCPATIQPGLSTHATQNYISWTASSLSLLLCYAGRAP